MPPPMLCGALVGALCGLAGFFVWVCALGVIRLPGANRVVLVGLIERVLHKREGLCVGVWSGVFTCVSLRVCLVLFGHGSPMYSPM
jgi:hypothetical protein